MKILNIFFIVLFVLSALLQYNDPDPYIWAPIYLYGALLCFLAIRGRYNSILYITGLVIYISFAIFLFIDDDGVLAWAQKHDAENIAQSMKATKPWIEQTREFFGLLVLSGALVANMIWYSRARKGNLQQYQKFWRGT
jgi:hypothetical protein